MNADLVDQIRPDDSDLGYVRPPALQAEFEAAYQHLLQAEGWPSEGEKRELRCDLALEGGGVKGIGLVGAVVALNEAGYRIQRVAGTSAGAIAAALIAGLVKSETPITKLKQILDDLDFTEFMQAGPVRHLWDHLTGKPGETVADFAALIKNMGFYSGDFLITWLTPILAEMGVKTYADLALSQENDPGMSLPPDRMFSLVVHTSDITRRELAQIPWDCDYYGLDPKEMSVVDSVRASMSIPFFFVPYKQTALAGVVDIPDAAGDDEKVHYGPGTVTWVDGGMLRNFPINAFERADGKEPRWPTIGIKLSGITLDYPPTRAASNVAEVAFACLHTMMNEWDSYNIEESTAARTIFVDPGGITTTQFDLSKDQKTNLFINGVKAATQFIIEAAAFGAVPKTDSQGAELVAWRATQQEKH